MVYQPYHLTPFFALIAITEFVPMRTGHCALRASVRKTGSAGGVSPCSPYRFSAERIVAGDERSRNAVEGPRDTKMWSDSHCSEGPITVLEIQEGSCRRRTLRTVAIWRRWRGPVACPGYLTPTPSRVRAGQPENRAGMSFDYKELATVYATHPDWLKAPGSVVRAARSAAPCQSAVPVPWGNAVGRGKQYFKAGISS
jgi:hypothetical protein